MQGGGERKAANRSIASEVKRKRPTGWKWKRRRVRELMEYEKTGNIIERSQTREREDESKCFVDHRGSWWTLET